MTAKDIAARQKIKRVSVGVGVEGGLPGWPTLRAVLILHSPERVILHSPGRLKMFVILDGAVLDGQQ